MKLNSTVALTFVLLALMFGAGLVSAAWGLVIGREALKGITQPDTRPANNLAQRKGNTPRREDVVILKEEDIISSVKARMNGGAAKPTPAAKPAESKPAAKSSAASDVGAGNDPGATVSDDSSPR
jgi:hypothetical protein